eukprot:1264979-Rhodomonas_salina.1
MSRGMAMAHAQQRKTVEQDRERERAKEREKNREKFNAAANAATANRLSLGRLPRPHPSDSSNPVSPSEAEASMQWSGMSPSSPLSQFSPRSDNAPRRVSSALGLRQEKCSADLAHGGPAGAAR